MSGYDTPEQIAARAAMFSRFARLQAIQEERRRPKLQLEPRPKAPSEEHYVTWRTKEEQEQYDKRELDYIKPYTAEYTTGTTKQTNDNGEQINSEQQDDDCVSNADTDTTVKDTDAFSMARAGTKSRKTKAPLNEDMIAPGPSNGGPSLPEYCSARTIAAHPSASGGDNKPSGRQAPSTCRDFDQTSTVMPPSEGVVPSDYETSVSIKELKKTYFHKYEAVKNLPIYDQRQQIINSINSYNVVIIEGNTGCGKTTQVPMYILEDAILDRPSDTSGAPVIYVTQPRRIAAKSIAERVNYEHGWTMPSVAGYQVSLEKVVGPDTVLVFCTAGVLLQKIIQEKSLKKYTHIIIDEAHERDADTDLLLMMIRKLMLTEMALFRLIIMSATMDIEKLKKYFTFRTKYGHGYETQPCHIRINANNRTGSNMLTYTHMDSLRAHFGVHVQMPEFDIESPEMHEDCLNAAVRIIVEVIPRLDNFTDESNSTLVFLPGLAEISRLDAMIKKYDGAKDNLDIIPLHSCLTVTDQFQVFKKSRPGCRKVILATNIAESSITVSDVGFIIDFCLTKTLMKDKVTRFPTLMLNWTTQDKCAQRAGRTGRCCPGKVFRMVPKNFFMRFKQYAEPELLVAPLEISVLRVKNFQMGEIQALFAIVMDPPPFNEIRTAVLELKQIGALAATHKGQLSDIDGDLTELGRVITVLPIDVNLSKLIVVAAVFDVVQDAIIVAACLSTNRSVVRFLYGNNMDSYDAKLDFARGSFSDLIVSLNCYKMFHEVKDARGRQGAWLTKWCKDRHLDERKLYEVDALVSELEKRLLTVNIDARAEKPNQTRDCDGDTLMLKLAFAAAFYPNYFITETLDKSRVTKELCGGMDPLRTVVLSGFPVNQVPLYKTQATRQIREQLWKPAEVLELDYIADVSRAYLVLKNEDVIDPEGDEQVTAALKADEVLLKSRNIPKIVYRALRFGDWSDIQIREYKDRAVTRRMDFYQKQKLELEGELTGKLLPPCMKVLDEGQLPDNSHLVRANDLDYMKITGEAPFYEVAFNGDQDAEDIHELFELEKYEQAEQAKLRAAGREHERNLAQKNHDIYKDTYSRIRGPQSPIRMSFRSILVKSQGYVVEVDNQSVNSILLDSEYKEARRQMLVAAIVTQSKRGRVSARDTTLMPNIRGLPTIMALLFAQYYRLIYNNELNCISGGVFGIGWTKEDDLPLDRQYEVDLSFDVHITKVDIDLVNMARLKMSQLLKFTEIDNSGGPQAKLQVELREIIFKLIRTKRYPLAELDMSMVDYPGLRENIFTKDAHNLPDDVLQEGSMRPFLPIMITTRNIDEWQLYEKIRTNLTYLNNIEQDVIPMPMGGVKCLVCGNGQKFCFIMALKIEDHLRTEGHKEKVAEFERFEEIVRQKLGKQTA